MAGVVFELAVVCQATLSPGLGAAAAEPTWHSREPQTCRVLRVCSPAWRLRGRPGSHTTSLWAAWMCSTRLGRGTRVNSPGLSRKRGEERMLAPAFMSGARPSARSWLQVSPVFFLENHTGKRCSGACVLSEEMGSCSPSEEHFIEWFHRSKL